MNREEKTQLLGELNELFNSSEIIVVSHYKGLTVKEVSELRDRIRKAGAGFRVTKNRITRLALKGTKFEGLTDLFTGPTAIAFANDPVSACKACVQFAKDNEKLIVVGGAMGTGVLSVAEINKLATISAISPSSLKSILYGNSNNPKILTLKMLCDGLDITLAEFFDTPEFNTLEQEIK